MDAALTALQEGEAESPHIDDAVLIAFVAGRLRPEGFATHEAHLAACEECRAALVGYGEVAEERRVTRAIVAIEGGVRQHRRRRVATALLAIAAAGTGAFVLGDTARRPPSEYVLDHEFAQPASLRGMGQAEMSYELRDRMVQTSVIRSGAVLLPQTGIDLVLRPLRPDTQPTALSLYVSRPDAPMERVPAINVIGETDDTPMLVVKRSAAGSFLVRGRGHHLFKGPPGAYHVTFVIAPAGSACERIDGHTIDEAHALCPDAIFWRDVETRFEIP